MNWMEGFLRERRKAGLLRELVPATFAREGKIRFGEKTYWNFSGNDYLGLAGHPELVAAAKKALEELGTSASASRLLGGDREIFHRLEEEIARLEEKEAALLFNSGYQANVGIISALVGPGDAVFSDRLNHASIVDGTLLSRARFFRFRHNDSGHLDSLLGQHREKFKRALIVTETVFSMEGDRAPLRELVELKERHRCLLMLDEAHAVGVFGRNGAGAAEEAGVGKRTDLIMGTFGKALGSSGAFLAGSRALIDYLINTCRSFIYSTGPAPATTAASLAALAMLGREPERRRILRERADGFRQALKAQGLEARGDSQIVPLIIGDNQRALEISGELRRRGFWVGAVRPPTVPVNEARIRFSLCYHHEEDCLDELRRNVCGLLGV